MLRGVMVKSVMVFRIQLHTTHWNSGEAQSRE